MNTHDLIASIKNLQDLIGLKEEPLAFLYSDTLPEGAQLPEGERACVVGLLSHARRGETAALSRERFGCGGGGYYLGFCQQRPGIAEFVSKGIPGQMEGEHYKKSPDLVRCHLAEHPVPPAPAEYAVFKPVSALTPDEQPLVIIYFGVPDELAGLVGLAGYARAEDAVICPFGSGCSGIVTRPLEEAKGEQPRAVLGMFDPSARPFIGVNELSFAAPLTLWEEMLGNAEESFLQTKTWEKVKSRIASK
jgi:uncharacterized protein (DUF169 family)